MKIILASKSPRRKEILQNLGVKFNIIPADTDESSKIREPSALVRELALRKGMAVAEKIINEIAEKEGSCVIVGRCADYILRKNPNCVGVFVYAPLEKRIERISKKDGITADAAETKIIKTDKRRSNYYNFYTNREWGDISNYELAISSHPLGTDKTAEMILEYVKYREGEK